MPSATQLCYSNQQFICCLRAATDLATASTKNAWSSASKSRTPRGWLDSRLGEVWASRQLLYFLAWRDVKVRYKQTVIGVSCVVLQPLLMMSIFTCFFERLAKLPSDALPYSVSYFAALAP